MCKEERCDIMEAIKDLPDAQKQFILGYAAGVNSGMSVKSDDNPGSEQPKAS